MNSLCGNQSMTINNKSLGRENDGQDKDEEGMKITKADIDERTGCCCLLSLTLSR